MFLTICGYPVKKLKFQVIGGLPSGHVDRVGTWQHAPTIDPRNYASKTLTLSRHMRAIVLRTLTRTVR